MLIENRIQKRLFLCKIDYLFVYLFCKTAHWSQTFLLMGNWLTDKLFYSIKITLWRVHWKLLYSLIIFRRKHQHIYSDGKLRSNRKMSYNLKLSKIKSEQSLMGLHVFVWQMLVYYLDVSHLITISCKFETLQWPEVANGPVSLWSYKGMLIKVPWYNWWFHFSLTHCS